LENKVVELGIVDRTSDSTIGRTLKKTFSSPMSRKLVKGGVTAGSLRLWVTSVSMIYRVRKQLVEEGFEAVLSHKQRATPAVARIFDVRRSQTDCLGLLQTSQGTCALEIAHS
jgi:hypothetical protein